MALTPHGSKLANVLFLKSHLTMFKFEVAFHMLVSDSVIWLMFQQLAFSNISITYRRPLQISMRKCANTSTALTLSGPVSSR
jgi:hypothetical protein